MDFQSYARTHGEFVHSIARQRLFRTKLLARIGKTAVRDTKRLLIRQFLLNSDMQTYYLFRSVRMKKVLGDFPPAALEAEREGLDPFKRLNEPVHAIVRRRQGSRRTRRVYQFGPRRHALQSMVADVLAALHPPRPDQFTIRGGVRAALLAVQDAVQLERTHAVERDIVGFYDHVKLAGLVDLLRPLPRGVIENVVWTRTEDISVGQPDPTIDEADHPAPLPHGGLLAQGAASSPIAAEIVVADLLRVIPDDVRVSAYADNILLLSESEQSVLTADIRLEDRSRTSACGPLGLKAAITTDIRRECLRFLGHDGYLINGRIEWAPSHEKLEEIETLIENSSPRLSRIQDTIRSLTHWRRGYPLWKGGEEWARRMRIQLLSKAYLSETNAITLRSIELSIAGELRSSLRDGDAISLWDFLPEPSSVTMERRTQLIDFLQTTFAEVPASGIFDTDANQ